MPSNPFRADPSVPSAALRHKEKGNRLYAAQDLDGARKSYQAAIACFPSDLVWPKHEAFVLATHSNLALTNSKSKDFRAALEHDR